MKYACKNIRYLRKLRGFTQDEFANKLKIKRSLLGAYEEGRAEPNFDVLQQLSHIFKLSLDDLLTKDLTYLSEKKSSDYISLRRKMKMSADMMATIEFVPIKVAAGYLAGYSDPEFIQELNTFTLPMIGGGNTYRAFEIIGDSMLPTPSGSVIIGEKVENIDQVKSNNAYIVLSRSEGIVYKRIQKNNQNKNKITLVSDNPVYHPYQINKEEILELWSALYTLQKASNIKRWDMNQLSNVVSDLQETVETLKKKVN